MKSILFIGLFSAALSLSACAHWGHHCSSGCGGGSECQMEHKKAGCDKCKEKCAEHCGDKCAGDECKMDHKSEPQK